MKKSAIIIFLTTIILSCSKQDSQELPSNGLIIFGEIYGQCAGDCRSLYLLTEQGIYKDSDSDTDFGNWENTTFENQALETSQFVLAKPLLQIPNKLLEYENEIGIQTLADFDYFIQIKTGDKTKMYIFDALKENIDTETKLYIENFIDINNQLRN